MGPLTTADWPGQGGGGGFIEVFTTMGDALNMGTSRGTDVSMEGDKDEILAWRGSVGESG